MKAFILCGGKGKRMRSYDSINPKPLIKINKKEILYWLMKDLHQNGINQFNLLCGYKYEYFINFKKKYKEFDINIINSGINSNTLKRVNYIKKFIGNDKYFFLTYGDTLLKVNLKNSIHKFYKSNLLILSHFYQKTFNYGYFDENLNYIKNKKIFNINAGHFLCKTEVLNFVENKNIDFENFLFKKKTIKKKLIISKVNGWFPNDSKEDLKKTEFSYFND